MLYVLLGEDDFSLRQSLEEIKRSAGDPAVIATNTTVLDGQQATVDQLKGICSTVPFLAEKRLVIVEGLLQRFEPQKGPGQKRKAARTVAGQPDPQRLAACFQELPDFAILLLVDGKIGNYNPLLKLLQNNKAVVQNFPLVRDARLRQWIQQRVKALNSSISPRATELLSKFVGSNLWIMASEIDKLVLFAGDRRIEEDDVTAIVSSAQEANIFAMVDAIVEFKSGAAENLLQQLLQEGAPVSYLLVMIARQVQMIVRVRELRSQRKSRAEIQNTLGLTSDFVLRKVLEQAEGYSLERLKQVYHKLLEADLSIKTGKSDGELALNVLIAELCQRDLISTN